MTDNDAMIKFLELLDAIQDNCKLFESLVLTTEIMGELPLAEEQIELANVYLENAQKEWINNFIPLLEICIKWLKQNNGGSE